MAYKIGITCYPTVGGSGVVATELGKLLAERGHEIHFITSGLPFRLQQFYPNIFYHEVEVNAYSVFQYPPYDLTLASKMAQVARREKLDLLHVHYAVPHAVCAVLAKQMVGDHLKVVTTLHGTDITVLGYDQTLSDIICFGINQSDAVTSVSHDLVEETKRLFDIKKDIHTVYNFVDTRVYQKKHNKNLKTNYNIQENEKVLIHISNFRKVKRIPDVIRIFERVQKEIPAKLLLVGDGPEYSNVCSMVHEKKLEDHVIFLGRQENISDLLAISDALLLVSEKESFGLVALEAMACGVPVIGSNAGGIPEVVIDGQTGYTGPIGDVEALAEKTIRLLTDDVLYEKMAKEAYIRATTVFSADQIVKQYESIYASLIQKES